MQTKVSTKGQVVLPSGLRRRLGLAPAIPWRPISRRPDCTYTSQEAPGPGAYRERSSDRAPRSQHWRGCAFTKQQGSRGDSDKLPVSGKVDLSTDAYVAKSVR